jgi:hypothetical protein
MLVYFNQNPAMTSIVILFLSSLVISIGWAVIYNNAQKIASRNETFNLVSKFLVHIDKLIADSILYWSSEANENKRLKSKKFELEIVSLKRSLEQLNRRGLSLNLDLEIRKLRRAITLDSSNKNLISEPQIILKIEDMFFYSDEIQNKLIQSFQDKY